MEEVVLSNRIEIITAEIKFLERSMKQSMIEHAWQIGYRLVHVKEELKHGNFGKWIKENFEFTWEYATKFMKFHKEFPNLKSISNLPSWTHVIELLSLPEEINREAFIKDKHVVPSTGEIKKVDEMSVREIKEVKKALKESEEENKKIKEENEKLEQQLKIAQNQKPKTIEVERVIQTVVQDDTEVQRLKKEMERQRKEFERLEGKYKLVEAEKEQYKHDADKHQKLKKDLDSLSDRKESIVKQINNAETIGEFIYKIQKSLEEDLAPVKYIPAMDELHENVAVKNALREIVNKVDNWVQEMNEMIGDRSKAKHIIEAEVIDYDTPQL